MKVALDVYARRPLGKLLGQILEVLSRHDVTAPKEVGLFSRSGRTDIPWQEVVASATRSASDTCTVGTAAGEIDVRWLYGPRAHVQSIAGTLSVTSQQCLDLKDVLGELCILVGAVYAYCDLQAVVDADTRLIGGMLYREQAFVGVYWFNYFGTEYRESLKIDEAIRAHATDVRVSSNGGLIVLLGATPEERDEANAKVIAERWPVFQKYRPGAKFREPIAIDYSDVRALERAPSAVTTIASTVGPAGEFIASVSAHAERFYTWAGSKGLSPKTEEDFQRIFQEHESIIRDELLVPAVAAYGEVVRTKMGGVWKKAELFHRGEPVVAKPGRPWTARRVIQEVLEGLEPIEV